MMIKSYSELVQLKTFEERYNYLKISGKIGIETFGYDRYLNQMLYRSSLEWKRFRREIILRDNGCDLGLKDREIISGSIIVHHINPITKSQIINRDPSIFDPENVISCMHKTHMAIHYGSFESIDDSIIIRKSNDTCPWKH